MALYDRPVWQLVSEALQELPDTFTTGQIAAWFQTRYPRVDPKRIRTHLRGMSVNNPPARKRHPELRAHGVLYKLDRSTYTKYDVTKHGKFDDYGQQREIDDGEPIEDEGDAVDELEQLGEFALEQHLEDFLEANWSRIDFGMPLDIWHGGDGASGRQFFTEIGVIDFLCTDRSDGAFVVVELKKGRTGDKVVGQCLRYMGWVKKHLATNVDVKGLIIAGDADARIMYALDQTPKISLRRYRVEFKLEGPMEV